MLKYGVPIAAAGSGTVAESAGRAGTGVCDGGEACRCGVPIAGAVCLGIFAKPMRVCAGFFLLPGSKRSRIAFPGPPAAERSAERLESPLASFGLNSQPRGLQADTAPVDWIPDHLQLQLDTIDGDVEQEFCAVPHTRPMRHRGDSCAGRPFRLGRPICGLVITYT